MFGVLCKGLSDWFCLSVCDQKNIKKGLYTSSKHIKTSSRRMYAYLGVAV